MEWVYVFFFNHRATSTCEGFYSFTSCSASPYVIPSPSSKVLLCPELSFFSCHDRGTLRYDSRQRRALPVLHIHLCRRNFESCAARSRLIRMPPYRTSRDTCPAVAEGRARVTICFAGRVFVAETRVFDPEKSWGTVLVDVLIALRETTSLGHQCAEKSNCFSSSVARCDR